jgi:hypothetical protein
MMKLFPRIPGFDPWAGIGFRWYAHGEGGPAVVKERRPAEMKIGTRQTYTAQQ